VKGVYGVAKGYFIQYKFILPETVKHSTYTYQKLFRAIYGYTQNVTKSNGKTYHYYRKGVLSDTPYIRPGKNTVIIHPSAFGKFKQFFTTGQNPTHVWRSKGDWKAVYYMDEKDIPEAKITSAVEDLLDRVYIQSGNEAPRKIIEEMRTILDKYDLQGPVNEMRLKQVLIEGQKITSNEWFQNIQSKSKKLTDFNEQIKLLKRL
jgi:hypothetical protein